MSSELHEQQRLAVLTAANLLDTPEEETFDRFTRLASAILNTPVALVSLVDRERQFFKSSVDSDKFYCSVSPARIDDICQSITKSI
jgi:diguanylate cyclase